MTMTYSFERKTDKWDTEPDISDRLLEEELELVNQEDLSLETLAEEELELDEEYDL